MRSIAVLSLLASAHACGAQLVALGVLPGQSGSVAVDISMDGTAVVGHTGTVEYGDHPWIWRHSTGIREMEDAPADSYVVSVSDDGAVAVTQIFRYLSVPDEVYRWREGVGSERLASLYNNARVSGDGQVVFGAMTDGAPGPVGRWTESTGTVQLADGMSGRTVVTSPTSSYTDREVRPILIAATNRAGTLAIGTAMVMRSYYSQGHGTGPFGVFSSVTWVMGGPTEAYYGPDLVNLQFVDASTDLVVRLRDSGGGLSRMVVNGQSVGLSGMPRSNDIPSRISGDGNIVVSIDKVWDTVHGTRTLTSVLTGDGYDLSGWSGLIVTGVDFDGSHLCGYGTRPSGVTEAWFAHLARCGPADFDHDGSAGTDADIAAFFACLSGNCCTRCDSLDFNHDGDYGTDADIESFFRVLSGQGC